MKTAEFAANSIDRLPKGCVFTYADFVTPLNKKEAVIKALNRMAAAGRIVKLAKGKFYKPEESAFGKLQPAPREIVKDLLEKDGKPVGYLTGYSIYNQLGLTTQVGSVIQIGRREFRAPFKRERYTISFVRQKNAITKANIPLLQILDALRAIKQIPDASPASACKRLFAIIKDLPAKDKSALARLALNYPPAVRALLGTIFDESANTNLTGPLRKSLNPITVYKIAGIAKLFPAAKTWNIK